MCKRISNGARYAGSMSVVRSVDGFEQWDQRRDIEKREIRPGYGRVQLNAASIDPGNRQAERLSADHVGELRLAGMENFVLRHAGMVDEVAEQGPVWLVTRARSAVQTRSKSRPSRVAASRSSSILDTRARR